MFSPFTNFRYLLAVKLKSSTINIVLGIIIIIKPGSLSYSKENLGSSDST